MTDCSLNQNIMLVCFIQESVKISKTYCVVVPLSEMLKYLMILVCFLSVISYIILLTFSISSFFLSLISFYFLPFFSLLSIHHFILSCLSSIFSSFRPSFDFFLFPFFHSFLSIHLPSLSFLFFLLFDSISPFLFFPVNP